MTMQKRHFEAIAETLQELAIDVERAERLEGKPMTAKDVLTRARVKFAGLGSRSNPNFKWDRFVAATLPGANVKART